MSQHIEDHHMRHDAPDSNLRPAPADQRVRRDPSGVTRSPGTSFIASTSTRPQVPQFRTGTPIGGERMFPPPTLRPLAANDTCSPSPSVNVKTNFNLSGMDGGEVFSSPPPTQDDPPDDEVDDPCFSVSPVGLHRVRRTERQENTGTNGSLLPVLCTDADTITDAVRNPPAHDMKSQPVVGIPGTNLMSHRPETPGAVAPECSAERSFDLPLAIADIAPQKKDVDMSIVPFTEDGGALRLEAMATLAKLDLSHEGQRQVVGRFLQEIKQHHHRDEKENKVPIASEAALESVLLDKREKHVARVHACTVLSRKHLPKLRSELEQLAKLNHARLDSYSVRDVPKTYEEQCERNSLRDALQSVAKEFLAKFSELLDMNEEPSRLCTFAEEECRTAASSLMKILQEHQEETRFQFQKLHVGVQALRDSNKAEIAALHPCLQEVHDFVRLCTTQMMEETLSRKDCYKQELMREEEEEARFVRINEDPSSCAAFASVRARLEERRRALVALDGACDALHGSLADWNALVARISQNVPASGGGDTRPADNGDVELPPTKKRRFLFW
uniref:Uncharacterized protein n=1 Tax=Noctiluca scintillans TaxID=2966 RepID=A0A7S0ZU54_NOCSC|eukprot:CAMPEP_0194529430 /NCGR_PEP_ID=MMETSP0253-20130528/66113_1 /TAXON_ID=2966 /ORGANISM="Noctiluca scintillans" /LENGTH=558 /DNA_ID=CAMNT_0039374573 /DNA_START=77 /DNA_END=1753 /DNA_ORIENTATION=-